MDPHPPSPPLAVGPAGSAERGATAVEYALLASLIAAVIVGVVVAFGGDVADLFATVDL